MQRCPKCGEWMEFGWESNYGEGAPRFKIPFKKTRRGTYVRHVCKILPAAPEYMRNTHDLGGVETWEGE